MTKSENKKLVELLKKKFVELQNDYYDAVHQNGGCRVEDKYEKLNAVGDLLAEFENELDYINVK